MTVSAMCTQGGIEKKATCRALFSKLLYLAESEELLPSLGQSERDALVRDVFGATAGDAAKLRIVSLLEVPPSHLPTLPGHSPGSLRTVAAVPLLGVSSHTVLASMYESVVSYI